MAEYRTNSLLQPLLKCLSQGSGPLALQVAASWPVELVAEREAGREGKGTKGKLWKMGHELGPLPPPFHDRCNLSLTPPSLEACTVLGTPTPAPIHTSILEFREPATFFSTPKCPTDPPPTCSLLGAACVTLWALSSASTRSPHCLSFLPSHPSCPCPPILHPQNPTFEFWFLPLFLPGGEAVSWLL